MCISFVLVGLFGFKVMFFCIFFVGSKVYVIVVEGINDLVGVCMVGDFCFGF